MRADRAIARRSILAAPVVVALGAAASCGFSDSSESANPTGSNPGPSGGGQSSGAPGGSKDLTQTLRQAMRPINHLNPAFAGGGTPQADETIAMMWEGLIRRDPADMSKYLPGAAEKWESSPDGRTYTFHLRDGLAWSNGEPLTATDFTWSYQYYFSPDLVKQGNKYSPSHQTGPNTVIKGLVDYYNGKGDFSSVGITASDDRTLVFTLDASSYTFLDSLVVDSMPLHRKSVEAHTKDFWLPEHVVGNGPYKLTSYKQNSGAALQANPHYWDAKSFTVTARDLQFNAAGQTSMMVSYDAGEIDLFRVSEDPTALIAGRSDVAKQLKRAVLTQYKALFPVPNHNPVLQENAKLRQALAMSLDRKALAQVTPPDVAGPCWVPSGISGADKVPQIPFDPDTAKDLLSEAGFPRGKGLPELTILDYAKHPVVSAVTSMWKKYLNVKAKVSVKEIGVNQSLLHGGLSKDFVGFSYSHVAPVPFSMMTYGAKYNERERCVPWDTWQQICKILYGSDKGKYTASQKQDKVTKLEEENIIPAYKKYNALVEQAIKLDSEAKHDEAMAKATDAAIEFAQTYLVIPLLWAGYTFMEKPRIHDLVLTSYPYETFTLKGVTLAAAK